MTAQAGPIADDPVSSAVRNLLQDRGAHVHLVGIGGVGMAGLAVLLKARGLRVTGCDLERNRLTGWLERQGIGVAIGHDAAHLGDVPSAVIRTAAVPEDAPEIRAALDRRLPVFVRGRVLPVLLDGRVSIAVSGTHGKTTTTTFIALLLAHAGCAPSWCIGGEPPMLEGVAGIGSGPIVVEADESDGTVAFYRPSVAVVTNIEFDHMEHFADVAAFESCFRTFAGQAGRIVYCADDPRAAALLRGNPRAVAYGLSAGADVRGRIVSESAAGSSVEVGQADGTWSTVDLPVPGRHNVLNLLAALTACREAGVSFEALAGGISSLRLPRRRFETIVQRPDFTVVSDYGHHPTEIAALVRTAVALKAPRLTAVFQPHRYTRTAALGADFPAAFAGVEELTLLPIYAASEQPVPGGQWWDLYAHFRTRSDGSATRVMVAESMDQAWAHVRADRRAGDVFLVVGAGSVDRIARLAQEESERMAGPGPVLPGPARLPELSAASILRPREPMASKTTLGVGGAADLWADVGDEADLISLQCWAQEHAQPFHVIGGGSNLLVSDLGVRGVVARLSGGGFRRIEEREGRVVAGAGVRIPALLAWMEEHRLTGLEFLAGIPGVVGGAVRMNAGAWGHSIGDHVAWIRCLNPDGSTCIVSGQDTGAGYRTCRSLVNRTALEVGFTLEPGEAGAIREAIREARGRRAWMAAERTAGSVFKNPPGRYAGALIEQAGLKGCRLGGAAVSDVHGNVIVAGSGATASDVLALVRRVQERVARQTGIELEPEICFLG